MTKLGVRIKVLWCFIFLFFIGINIFTLKDGHNWGGDFSQYIIHAQNIVNHQSYIEGITLNPSVVYPPGFPFILSFIIKIFGVQLYYFKFLNILFWFLSVLCFLALFLRKISGQGAILCALLLSSSSCFFVFKQSVLSDVPFAFFVSLGLFLFMKYDEQRQKEESFTRNNFFWLLTGVMVFAFLVRTAGVILFVSFAFYVSILRRGRIKDVLFILGILCVVFVLQSCLIGIYPSAVNNIVSDPAGFLSSIGKNHSIVFLSIVRTFIPPFTVISEALLLNIQKVLLFILWPLYGLISWAIFKRIKNQTLTFAECFLFFYVLLLFVWSGHGIFDFFRFIIPVMGVVLLVVCEFLKYLSRKFLQKEQFRCVFQNFFIVIVFVIILLNILNIAAIFNFDDDVIEKRENKQLFEWVVQNVPLDKHYLFDYERVMALKTGRVGTSLRAILIDESSIEIIDFSRILKEKGVEYIILSKLKDQSMLSVMGVKEESDQYGLKFLWENDLYRIFQVI